jgi:threonine/homoserine/homoserine lactone efflux protein
MPSVSTIAVFAGAALVLFVVPGPSVLYVVTRSIDQGRRAGLASVLGVHAGSLVHVAAAIAGLSAVVASSAVAFSALRYAGAAYLIWLGVRRIRSSAEGPRPELPPVPTSRVLAQGFVVNVLNPKTAIFFVAFLPQFVDPGAGPVAFQLAVLGAVFVALGLLSDSTYAMVASAIGARLGRTRHYESAHRWGTGLVYLGLGAVAAVSGSRTRGAT